MKLFLILFSENVFGLDLTLSLSLQQLAGGINLKAIADGRVDKVQLWQFDAVVDDQRRFEFPVENQIVCRVRNCSEGRRRKRKRFQKLTLNKSLAYVYIYRSETGRTFPHFIHSHFLSA